MRGEGGGNKNAAPRTYLSSVGNEAQAGECGDAVGAEDALRRSPRDRSVVWRPPSAACVSRVVMARARTALDDHALDAEVGKLRGEKGFEGEQVKLLAGFAQNVTVNKINSPAETRS